MRNQGTEFEQILETQHAAYAVRGLATLHKTSQPVKVFGGRGAPLRVIHLVNPFLDFVGCWKEQGGRSMHIEAKMTSQPRLPIWNDTGLKPQQIENLQAWHDAGAAVGTLWHHAGQTKFVTLAAIYQAREDGRESIPWAAGHKLHQTDDLIFWDYLPILRVLYPCIAQPNGQSTVTPV